MATNKCRVGYCNAMLNAMLNASSKEVNVQVNFSSSSSSSKQHFQAITNGMCRIVSRKRSRTVTTTPLSFLSQQQVRPGSCVCVSDRSGKFQGVNVVGACREDLAWDDWFVTAERAQPWYTCTTGSTLGDAVRDDGLGLRGGHPLSESPCG